MQKEEKKSKDIRGLYLVQPKLEVRGWDPLVKTEAWINNVFTGKKCIFKRCGPIVDQDAGYKTFASDEELLEHFNITSKAE